MWLLLCRVQPSYFSLRSKRTENERVDRYYLREDALDCIKYLNGTRLDERIIRTDLDPGFVEGRQYGRGRSGGQARDEFRETFDEGRGGWGHEIAQQKEVPEVM